MSYIGRSPQIGAYSKLDAITTDGSASYTMQLDSANFVPESVNHLIVSVNGVIQAPTDSFTVSGSTITFASSLSVSDTIDFIMALGNVLDIGTPSDSTVSSSKIIDGAVSLAKLSATGTKDATTFLRGDNTFATPSGGENTPAFEAHFTGSQGFSDATDHKVICSSEIYDSDSCYDTTTGRFTPTEAGRYVIYGQAYAGCGAANMYNHGTKIFKNGTAVLQSYIDLYTNTGNAGTEYISCVVYLNGSSDYVELYVQTDDTSGNPTLYSTVGNQATFFGGYKLIGA